MCYTRFKPCLLLIPSIAFSCSGYGCIQYDTLCTHETLAHFCHEQKTDNSPTWSAPSDWQPYIHDEYWGSQNEKWWYLAMHITIDESQVSTNVFGLEVKLKMFMNGFGQQCWMKEKSCRYNSCLFIPLEEIDTTCSLNPQLCESPPSAKWLPASQPAVFIQ